MQKAALLELRESTRETGIEKFFVCVLRREILQSVFLSAHYSIAVV
jgi:hypothetical protein